MAKMGILSVPSGGCDYSPLSTLRVSRGESRQRDSALSDHDTQGRIESVQLSQGKFTVTLIEDCAALRADRGQVQGMRFGRSRQEPDEATSHTGVPRLRGKVRKHWASLCRPTPEILKTYSVFSEFE
jgi:hypothetical protein